MKTKIKSGAYILRSAACAAFLSFSIVALTSAFNLSNRLPKSVMPVRVPANAATDSKQPRALTFADRVAYQRAIEEIHWQHRIWPKENAEPKPSLNAVMSQAQIEKKVEDYLRDSQLLADYWQRPITPEQLQAEMERRAQHTNQPDVLPELFEAPDNDLDQVATMTCTKWGTISINGNQYIYQQNEWNSNLTQCASVDDTTGAWTITQANFNLPNGGPPATYPSIFRGCHWGNCSSNSGLPIQVSALGRATSSWSTTQVSSGAYNVAYDLWTNTTPTTSGQPNGSEIMIWLNSRGGIQPAGQIVGTATIGGATWNVWTTRMSGWNYIAYQRLTGTTSVSDLDIKAFVQDSVNRGSTNSSWYLLDAEAGFEIWRGGQGLGTHSFSFSASTGAPSTNPATNVASFSATLNGSVDPHGLATTVSFQYGTTTSYGHTTAHQTQTGSTYRNVTAHISSLSANTTYHFRIVASNSGGTRYGADRTFTTLSPTGPPVGITNPATLIASFSATLHGTLDPHGLTTTVHFQYGATTSYGLTTAAQTKSGNTYQSVSANTSGLTASTTYHFRFVATNSAGTTYGPDHTFRTLSPTGPPAVLTNSATNVTSSSATLNGSVDPHALATNVHFQYGTTTSYGSTTPNQTNTGNAYLNVSANISGLSGGTTYHFRVVATNTAGTRYGADRTFTTPP